LKLSDIITSEIMRLV